MIFKKIIYCTTIMMFSFACHTAKKVQIFNEAVSKKDTVATIIIKENPKVDSAAIVREILDKVAKQKIDFNTFYAKTKVEYIGQEKDVKVTAYIKMKKDSVIFIQVTYPVIGVLLEAQITKDSVIVVNVKDKEVQLRSISYLQEITQIPFDLTALQDLIIGNPIFLNKKVASYKTTDNQLLILMIGSVFKHLITLENTDFKPLHSKLDDVDPLRNRTCDITFSTYEKVGNIQFSTYRSISVAEKLKLDVYLDFKNYTFNEPLNYSFKVPKKYTKK